MELTTERFPMRGSVMICLALVFLAAGCASEEDYYQVMREQRQALKEVADILETVKDEESMATAKVSLDQQVQKFDAISKRARALPNPPPKEVIARMNDEKRQMETHLERLRIEVRRINQLRGGPEFWKQFPSDSQGLFSVQP
jgi:hypothetical protein